MKILRSVVWSTGSILDRSQTPVPRAFLEWHRAHLLGLSVSACNLDGHTLDSDELFRLNFWIRAQGAWRCSLLPTSDANVIVSRVIEGGVVRIPVGRSGDGRLGSNSGRKIIEL